MAYTLYSSRWRRVTLLGISLVVFATADLYAADTPQDQAAKQTQRTRQRKIRDARRTVHGLELTPGQARLLLLVVEEAAVLQVDRFEVYGRRLPELIDAFTDFAHDDSFNQGFSPAVERRTRRLNHDAKEVRERYEAEFMSLEERAAAVLSPYQRELAVAAKPRRRKGRGGGVRHSPDRLATAKRELSELNRQVHPRVGTLGERLLHPAAAEAYCEIGGFAPTEHMILAARLLDVGTKEYPRALVDLQLAEVRRLRDEINNWNLINGLHLDVEQSAQLVSLYHRSRSTVKAARENDRYASGSQSRHTAEAVTVDVERGVESILNTGQRKVLAEYKACLIPPKNLKNPVRAGQANDDSQVEKWLTRARKASAFRLEAMVDEGLDHEVHRFGELTSAERRARRALVLDTVKEAAKMSDVDFELNRSAMARSIAPVDRAKLLKIEIADLSRERGLSGPIARFILKPSFIDQLRVRGEQLVAGVKHRHADLAKGPQAENCAKGCAIKTTHKSKKKRHGR